MYQNAEKPKPEQQPKPDAKPDANGKPKADAKEDLKPGAKPTSKDDLKAIPMADLEAKLGEPPKTPDTSSVPPSQGKKPNLADKPKREGPRKGSLGRKGGGRMLVENPDETVIARPMCCAHCQVSMPVEFSPKAPLENSPLRFGSVTAITTGRDDRGEVVEVEIDDGVKRWAVALSRRLSGKVSDQATYSACRASSPATVSHQRWARLRRSAGFR